MKENEFIWTDALVSELAWKCLVEYKLHDHKSFVIIKNDVMTGLGEKILDKFKQSKNKYLNDILAFKDQYGYIYKKNSNNGKFVFDNNTLEAMLNSPNHKIHSVQNGDEILTVGDERQCYGAIVKIQSFEINELNKIVYRSEGDAVFSLDNPFCKKVVPEKTYTASEVSQLFKKFLETI